MALHGSLEVNGRVIGQWEAVRRSEVAPGWHEYSVHVHVHATNATGKVIHRYADGPAVLAVKALSVYAQGAPVGVDRLGGAVCKGLGKGCGLAPHHDGKHLPVAAISERIPEAS